MLTIQQAAIDLLSKLGIELTDPTTATALQQQDVIVAMNGAGQWLQRGGEDFFTRTSITIGLSAGTAIYELPETVQAVIGPVRLNNQIPLAALRSRGELDQFDRIFLGAADYGAAAGVPIAYWPESLFSGLAAGDTAQINLWLAPTPASNPGSVTVECVDAFPAFTVANIGSTNALPVAKNYAETIFLPIARYLIMLSSQFSRPDLAAQITAEYQRALDMLGTAGGFPDAAQTPNAGQTVEKREVRG